VKHAISNIALTPRSHLDELPVLAEMGFTGLEVAPSRIWEDSWHGARAKSVDAYRLAAKSAGLEIVGLHSLLFDQPGLNLFADAKGRRDMLDFFVHLSGICRDLGGRTLIWGGGRRRGDISEDRARAITEDFFAELSDRTENDGTIFCLEPLAREDTDFLHSILETQEITQVVGRAQLKVQADTKALAANGEINPMTFRKVAKELVHVHANEPGFERLGDSGMVDHAAVGQFLNEIDYSGYVSVEQKMIDSSDIFGPIGHSMALLRECYT